LLKTRRFLSDAKEEAEEGTRQIREEKRNYNSELRRQKEKTGAIVQKLVQEQRKAKKLKLVGATFLEEDGETFPKNACSQSSNGWKMA